MAAASGSTSAGGGAGARADDLDSKIKVVVVGPKKVGKSVICDFLSGQKDSIVCDDSKYIATAGCRILETEMNGSKVEVWDVSGDQAHEACWPAIQQKCSGVIFMYDPTQAGHKAEIALWHDWFVTQATKNPALKTRFDKRQVAVIAYVRGDDPSPGVDPPAALRGYELFSCSKETTSLLREALEIVVSNAARAS